MWDRSRILIEKARALGWLRKTFVSASCAALILVSGISGDVGTFALAGGVPGQASAAETIRINLEDVAKTVDSEEAVAQLPVAFLDISRDRAREINGAIPFSTAPNPAARPFAMAGDAASRARAAECLAAAQYYEAGSDWEGQRAVAQVVLNRVRHPSYPTSVCGVVFQGAERITGCQFTFTCDGSLARTPVPDLWRQTLAIAREALGGAVYAKVGMATHYHTDWVVPYWSGTLEKITNVRTHLFFRWPGASGRPDAFYSRPSAEEPFIAKIARIAAAHRAGEGEDDATELAEIDGTAVGEQAGLAPNGGAPLPSLPGINLRGSQLKLAHPEGDAFGFLLPTRLPGSFGLLAYDVCDNRSFCKVMGWTDGRQIPSGFPVSYEAQSKMAFYYVYDRASRREIMAWDCSVFPRDDPEECLTPQLTRWDAIGRPAN